MAQEEGTHLWSYELTSREIEFLQNELGHQLNYEIKAGCLLKLTQRVILWIAGILVIAILLSITS